MNIQRARQELISKLLYWRTGLERHLREECSESEVDNNFVVSYFTSLIECTKYGAVFDCTHLDPDFLSNTGFTYKEELDAFAVPPFKLPHPRCLFFFDVGLGSSIFCIAQQIEKDVWFLTADAMHQDRHLIRPMLYPSIYGLELSDIQQFLDTLEAPILWTKKAATHRFFTCPIAKEGEINDSAMLVSQKLGCTTLGFLDLLNRDYIIQEHHEPKQLRKGKKSARTEQRWCRYWSTKLNLKRIREDAQPADNIKRESPCLHWRRGHWRTLHRGEPNEQRIWVDRCLVGDPAKGFHQPDYEAVA